jgi:hypothetical protein
VCSFAQDRTESKITAPMLQAVTHYQSGAGCCLPFCYYCCVTCTLQRLLVFDYALLNHVKSLPKVSGLQARCL